MLGDLRQAFIDARDAQANDEATAIDNFNTSTSNLQDAITQVEEELRNYDSQKSQAESDKSNAQETVGNKSGELDLAEGSYTAKEDLCATESQ